MLSPKKAPPQADPIEAAHEAVALVNLDSVAVPGFEKLAVKLADAAADPGFLAVKSGRGAAGDDRIEIVVDPDFEHVRADGPGQALGKVEAVERDDACVPAVPPRKASGLQRLPPSGRCLPHTP